MITLGWGGIINSDMPLEAIHMLFLESEVSCAAGQNKQIFKKFSKWLNNVLSDQTEPPNWHIVNIIC